MVIAIIQEMQCMEPTDFQYCFSLKTKGLKQEEPRHANGVDELVFQSIRALLEVGRFTIDGRPVQVTGFLYHNGEKHITLFPEDAAVQADSEPGAAD